MAKNNHDWVGDLKLEVLEESLASLQRVDNMVSLLMKVLAQENFNTKIAGLLTQNYWRLGDNLADFHSAFQKWQIRLDSLIREQKKKAGFQTTEPPPKKPRTLTLKKRVRPS